MATEFTASVDIDRRLYRHDIAASLVHANMLHRIGVIDINDLHKIQHGLQEILADIESGTMQWSTTYEDVHMNIEVALTERIGEAGKKLHTARSRNDQVVTDMRLWLRDEIDELSTLLHQAQDALLNVAEREVDTLMPGLTHLQPAQPVSAGHHIMAWHAMLVRDRERLADCRRRTNRSPLGAAALAGSSYPVDRQWTAKELDFEQVIDNSMDAVSDRDFVMEFISMAAMLMVHLSRIAEELILWSSLPFSFIELPDTIATGSSIMPQKKNPDVPELIRGKSARVLGNLMSIMTLMRAQPLTYNRDNQEDKQPLFDTVDTVKSCLTICTHKIFPHMRFNRNLTAAMAEKGYTNATDFADYLVGKGLSFRDAYQVTGQVVKEALAHKKSLDSLPVDQLQSIHPQIGEDVYQFLSLKSVVASRDHIGGTAPAQVRAALARARRNSP